MVTYFMLGNKSANTPQPSTSTDGAAASLVIHCPTLMGEEPSACTCEDKFHALFPIKSPKEERKPFGKVVTMGQELLAEALKKYEDRKLKKIQKAIMEKGKERERENRNERPILKKTFGKKPEPESDEKKEDQDGSKD